MALKKYIRWSALCALVCVCALAGCADTTADQAPTDGTPTDGMPTDGTPTDGTPTDTTSTAEYTITFIGAWSEENNGRALPGGAHLTTLAGATHTADYTIWKVGGLATVGVESIAEDGNISTLRTEVNAQINSTPSTADQFISILGGGPSFTSTKDITASSAFPYISLLSMVAPTADWFVGTSAISLLHDDGEWKDEITHDLRVYDAGTEQDVKLFDRDNVAESPHKLISRLVGNADIGFDESQNQHIIGQIKITRNN